MELARTPEDDRHHEQILNRLLALRPKVETSWLAALARVPFEQCNTLHFKFRCPKKWSHLQQTDDVRVRSCESCRKTVHYYESIGEARAQAFLHRYVAVDLGVKRSPGDLKSAEEYSSRVGEMIGDLSLGMADPLESSPAADDRPFWRRWLGW